jgi:hypothetical protein
VALLACPLFEAFYGGARGGGKTDGMLGEWAQHAQKYGEHATGVFFRRELTQLDEAIERSKAIYGPIGADWTEQKKQWRFPNGARLKFRYLDRDDDAEAYQGHSYTRVYFEELTNFPSPKPVMKLKATLRSAAGVPCRFRATGNPGGPGHQWVKARYIDPAPNGYVPLVERDPDSGLTLSRVFIPAKLGDNRRLLENDPTYVMRLKQSGSVNLVRAWLNGDWSVIEGAFFDNWDGERHVIRPFAIPPHWTKFRSFDWGSAAPFSCGWWAVSDGTILPDGRRYPTGAMIRYREWYGARKLPDGATEPNVGLKLTAEQIADGILERERGEEIHYGVADPAIFAQDGGPSHAERMMKRGARFRPADNARVARHGHMGGWDQMRARLDGEEGKPMVYCFSTCVDSIRTIPVLQHDKTRPEDLDTDGEDHAADDWRYACMSRPFTRKAQVINAEVDTSLPTLNQLWATSLRPQGSARI